MTIQEIEKAIIRRCAEAFIAAGCYIDVNDGEETVLQRSQNVDEILGVMFSTDEDYFQIWVNAKNPPEFRRIGFVRWIYGNGVDVLSDYTDSERMNDLLVPINNYVTEMVKKYG